jgi:hypothetical protein
MHVGSLRPLSHPHGAPRVLKADNGSPFIAHETRCFCQQQRVS